MNQFDYDYLFVLFSKAHKHIQKTNMDLLAPHGLSSLHAMYLMTLYKNPDGLTRKELNEKLAVNKANTSRAINDLIGKGYACLDKNSSSERNVKILMTESGIELAKLLKKTASTTREKFLSVMTDEEKTVLQGILQKMINLDLDQ